MHAATVELLVQKAHLDPDTAIAIATAIDMALQNAQLVTVAVLDARFLAFEAKVDARFAASETKWDFRFSASETKWDFRFSASEAKWDARFSAFEAKMDAALQKTKAELVRWVFLAVLGNVALSVAANSLQNTLQHLP
jgi:hypothetical protein